jgi:hypothetical protein
MDAGKTQDPTAALPLGYRAQHAARLEWRRSVSRSGLPLISFSEVLLPEPGWRVDHAVLATYSADLVVLVSALISLSGTELDQRAKGTRAELVHAMSSLRDRVRILVQAGRVSLPGTPRAILGLLDEFVMEIDANEEFHSWHPKAALVRYVCDARPGDCQWRLSAKVETAACSEVVETVQAADIRVFRHWTERLREGERTASGKRQTKLTSFALPYWFSIPLAYQRGWSHGRR